VLPVHFLAMSDDPGPGRVEPRRRAIGCLSFLLFLSSGPLGIVGFIFLTEARDSKGATPLSGLSAIGGIIGVATMLVALVALVAGAIFFVRSAKD
jgi:hypothetical protein